MVEGLMLYIPNKGISYFTAANVQNFQKMMTPRIVIIPTPGLGQLIPLTEFAKQLVLHHNFCVTFLLPTDGSSTASQLSLLLTLPASISHLFLSPVNLSDLPLDTHIFTRIVLTLTRSIPALRDPLRQLSESTRLVAIVFDLFGPVALNLAGEFGVPGYIFFACSALNLCLNLCLPKLDQKHTCQYRHLPDPVQLFPGCVLVHGIDMIDPVQERRNEAYELVLDIAKRYKEAAGIMVNSFLDLEPAVFKALSENEGMAPLFPIGPLIQTGLIHAAAEPDQCLRWLDQQPSVSVLFVSFGSGGTLSSDQIIELAFGLEISRQRFIWVIRNPNDKDASAAYFNRQASNDPLQFLPDGFLERIRGLGLVVPLWAPQIQILNHSSTGGFLTHCGWNSTLESIVGGIPLIAWPLYAEQRLNAVELSEDFKVALRVKPNEKGIVERGQITDYVRTLIEGEEGKMLREKMRVLRSTAIASVADDGQSTKKLAELAQILKS